MSALVSQELPSGQKVCISQDFQSVLVILGGPPAASSSSLPAREHLGKCDVCLKHSLTRLVSSF